MTGVVVGEWQEWWCGSGRSGGVVVTGVVVTGVVAAAVAPCQ